MVRAFRDSLARQLPTLMAHDSVPGVAVAVVQDGAIVWSQGYGYADIARRTPVTPQTVFQVASISKSLAAWGVMRLVERGAIDLDAPIDRYLTRWHLPATDSGMYRDEVTIRRVLSHTAGLSLSGYPGFDPDSGPLPTIEASLSGNTNGAGDVHVAFRPGARWQYSGGGYTMLQLLIEERSGRTFIEYMRSEVLEPLGMRSSSYDWLPRLRARTATGYDHGERQLPNYRFTALAAAGLYTTVEDLARFVAAAMPGVRGEPVGRGVVRPETLAEMLEPEPHSENPYGRYGFGYIVDTLSNGVRLALHTGGNRGWRSLYVVMPERRAGLAVLTNSDVGDALAAAVACTWYRLTAGGVRRGC